MIEKKNFYFFAVILFLLVAGTIIFGVKKFYLREDQREQSGEKRQTAISVSSDNSAVTAILGKKEDETVGSTVVYKSGAFASSTIILRDNEEHTGCFVTIVNRDSRPLLIRLSPHTAGENWGTLYPEIPAGGSISLDPRFRIPKIAFHNHKNLSEEFSVTLGESCSNF